MEYWVKKGLRNLISSPLMIFLILFPASTLTFASSLSGQESCLKVLLVTTVTYAFLPGK